MNIYDRAQLKGWAIIALFIGGTALVVTLMAVGVSCLIFH